MKSFQYVIVGGGMTADAAVRGIRELDGKGSIAVFGAEAHPPYNRPPLTKGLWKGKAFEKIWRHTGDVPDVQMYLGLAVTRIDPQNKTLTAATGDQYVYEKLLLATGGSPRRLSAAAPGILYYRTVDDYEALRALTQRGDAFAVVGGGFIGTEIAAALNMNGKAVTLVFPGDTLGAHRFPSGLAHFIDQYYQEKGVRLLAGERVQAIAAENGRYTLQTQNGVAVTVDGVVAGLGIEPNTGLAQTAALTITNGIVVNEFLQTSEADIYAAGDVANFYNPALDTRLRVEHEDNANKQGKAAGRNMAGAHERYDYLPLFYSDLFDLGFEAVGELDARLETVEDWIEPYRKGVVYYLKDGRVRGVLLWNTWNQVPAARQLIAAKEQFTPQQLRGKIQ